MLALKITPERLKQLQQSTSQGETLQTLKTTILTWWPMQKEEVPIKIRELWSYHDELTIHNDVLFKVVGIPQLLRPKVKSRIHSKNLGVEVAFVKLETLFSGPAWMLKWVIKSSNAQSKTNFKLRIWSFLHGSKGHLKVPDWVSRIQTLWQRLNSACGLLFRLSWSQKIGREHL